MRKPLTVNGWEIKPDADDSGAPAWYVDKENESDRSAAFSHFADALHFAQTALPEAQPDIVVGARWDGTMPCPGCGGAVPVGDSGSVQCPHCMSMLSVSIYMHVPHDV